VGGEPDSVNDTSVWQPARIVSRHAQPNGYSRVGSEESRLVFQKVVRVTEGDPGWELKERFAISGCEAKRFFYIHPEDLPNRHAFRVWVCECMILTD